MLDELFKKYRFRRLNRLAKKMQKGDSAAAEEIYKYFVDKIFGFLLIRLRNKTTAEDLTQAIFLKLLDKIDLYNPKIGGFSPWFWQLARNTLMDYYRNLKKTEISFSQMSPAEEKKIQETVSIGDEFSDAKAEWNWVLEFLKTLPPEEQEIVELRFVAQLSFREMAQILNKNEGALRVKVMRLKRRIKENFKSKI